MTPRALLAPGRLAGRPILRTQTDERLVDLVRAGSEPAFEAIVARYRRPLLRYCSRILTEERAEDAVQQTFVRAYGAMRKNSAELSLCPWLYRIAHNTALNALRDRGLRHEELTDQLDGVERPDQILERSQDLRDVVSAVQELPERQRDAIVLRELEGRSYDEIAHELGVTDGAVRQLLNRARNTLREAATALTPGWLLMRVPFGGGGEPVAVRIAEICGAGAGAGAGAVAAKVCATALVTGAVVSGGVALGPDVLPGESARGERGAPGQASPGGAAPAVAPVLPAFGAPGPASAGGGGRSDDGEERSGSSGSGSSGGGSGSDNSGPGSVNSGPGSVNSGPGSVNSGSGSSGSGSGSSDSGSGSSDSGSGSSGSGSSGSNSGEGSGSSGSGSGSGTSGSVLDSSGSGSGTSGSGSDSSGSGSSGSDSDSSGSGSGSDDD